MELPDFIAELEKAISLAGSDEVWKKTIGDKVLWFSPVTSVGQEKTNETLANAELGVNIVFEGKKMTLSHAIVGIGDLDLRQWRSGAAVFPILNKEGKKVSVRLEEYIYAKMKDWGGQFIDDVFSVYADLIETHQKNNLKDVRFENAKDPRLELMELEARVAELRRQLSMPALVEQGSPAAGPASPPEPVQEEPAQEPAQDAPPIQNPDFNPFAAVRNDGLPRHVREAEARRDGQPVPRTPPAQPLPAPPSPPADLAPLPPSQTPEDELFSQSQASSPMTDPNPARPRIQVPPVRRDDVLEKPAERVQMEPPRIDGVVQNVNPRFRKPGG